MTPPLQTPAALREITLHVEGVACGACVRRVEGALRALPFVLEASLDLATRRARIVASTEESSAELIAALARAGYRAREGADGEARRLQARRALWRVALAGFAMMQVMMFAVPAYVADEGTLSWDVERLFSIASLLLTVPVLLFCAPPIFRSAWSGLAAREPGMDLPVALGIAVSFAASLHGTFLDGPVYYDSITMFVFFLLTARYLEEKALGRTSRATEALATLLPKRARRVRDARLEEVDPAALGAGDRVLVAAGEAAPADLVLLDGETEFDEALVTGESAPVAKKPGDRILAGTANLSTPVEARVERAGSDQTLAQIRRLIERAAAHKPRWSLLADRIAGRFAVAVLAVAAAGALVWLWVDPSKAWWVAVTTLVVTCPCALSLATPAASAAALNALVRRGVLVTKARGLESLAAATHVVFDKTGTLTTGRMRLADVRQLGALGREECISIAAALESALPHPIAHALAGAHPYLAVLPARLRAFPGMGVEGTIDGRTYRVGSPAFCAELCGEPPPRDDWHGPSAAFASEGGWLAIFRFEDALRPEAVRVVERIRRSGREVVLLSGDRRAVVDPVADALGIRERVCAADPEAKARFVERLAATGARVAMVGDGANDAPVLAQAHVAVALGQGAAVAQSQADFVLLNPSLEALADALEVANRSRSIIRQNLAWAAVYNATTLPLALAGVLTPWMASLGMSLSSLLVVGNALRLARDREPDSRFRIRPPTAEWTSSTS